ncbi:hypothetical protein EDD85DRAFT_956722 [Armillaria nabsnona]|nr:hypothetical protein EDD85DRAFT_956722 [Armillaria nabsnona]
MSSLPFTFVLGLSDLGISISMPGPISALTKNTMMLYAEAIGQAVNAKDNDSHLDELKDNLIALIEKEGGTLSASDLFCSMRPSPSMDRTLLSKAMNVISNAKHIVPLDSREWTAQLLRIAREMTPEDVAELKSRCSMSIWAALVFSNI